MIERILTWAFQNRFLILFLTALTIAAGVYSVSTLPIDAIPDLSDVQVIVYTEAPGQAPEVVEQQITYPLTSTLLSVPRAQTVRGYSYFGFSLIYILFEDGTDLYWARSRVLEYLSTAAAQLPPGVVPRLGPDASGVGWVLMYALRSTKHDLAQLRSLQDWYLRYELSSIDGVAEVAPIGGFVRSYRITLDPLKLYAYGLTVQEVEQAIRNSNREVGGEVIEMGEMEFMLRGVGFITSEEDLRRIPVALRTVSPSALPSGPTTEEMAAMSNPTTPPRENTGLPTDKLSVLQPNSLTVPIFLEQIAQITPEPMPRRGIAELDGQGEVVGAIVIARYNANALQVCRAVKQKLETLRKSLPEGVELVITYDRSKLIEQAIATLREKLVEESLVVLLVCFLFLFHFGSGVVILLALPVSILLAFVVMKLQGIHANIMSLGGIAIAIGAMVDAGIVMVENAHRKLALEQGSKPRGELLREAALEVAPSLFYALLLITLSFLPVFALEAQEGRLFKPLAFTKTYAMAAAALVSITLVPVLMGLLVRGRGIAEEQHPVTRVLSPLYERLLRKLLRHPGWTLGTAALLALSTLYPLLRLGSEFMPPLWEGDLLYMPTTLPGISITKAREVLQQTDKLLRQFPEVERVFGKIGRAETPTDPAPLDMLETTILLKPRKQWRPGVTPDSLIAEMDAALRLPGLSNAWTMPIRTRIDMLTTGIRTPLGIKLSGPDLATLEQLGEQVEALVRRHPHTRSVYAERILRGKYVDIVVDRYRAARYGLTVGDVHTVIQTAIGGMPITYSVEGRERYPITLRYPRELRDNPDALKRSVLIPTPLGKPVPLGEIADIRLREGAMLIKSEDAIPTLWVYIDIHDIDPGTYVAQVQELLRQQLTLPPGYTLRWSGQYEFLRRAQHRLLLIVPVVLALIVLLLYLNTRSVVKVAIVLLAAPFSLIGAFWLLSLLGYNLSVAVWVGLIALAGLDAETGVVMLLYLDLAYEERRKAGMLHTLADLQEAVLHGAARRLRPKLMTVLTIFVGLLPIMWSNAIGADVMKRIAAPMVGGIVTSLLLELLVYPVIYYLWRQRTLAR